MCMILNHISDEVVHYKRDTPVYINNLLYTKVERTVS